MVDMKSARALLAWAAVQNPGPWVAHSETVAQAAGTIAEACDLDAEYAGALGMLHDIGRYHGPSDMMYILDGYRLMMEHVFHTAAQICITHSFPNAQF